MRRDAPVAVVPKPPTAPSHHELDEHEATGHVQYRSWCAHCVRARATVNPHYKAPPKDENAVPSILFDYLFMGEDDGKSIPILGIKDDKSKSKWCEVVERKGVTAHATRTLVDAVKETGYKRVILKSDNEPAIKAFKDAAIKDLLAYGVE